MEKKKLIFKLTKASGISGDETGAVNAALELLQPYGKCSVDKLGNLICEVVPRGESDEHILLDAHIDEIGLMITGITDDGFLRFAPVGGVDARILSAAEVTVHGKEDLFGIITNKPPHLTSPSEYKKAEKMDKLFIDIGYSKEQAEKLVSIGDSVTMIGEGKSVLGDRIISKALDDRIGCAAIIRCLELLHNKKLGCGLTVMFSTREEIGSQGAKAGTYALDGITKAISVDITFGDMEYVGKNECGRIGGGPMIGVSPILDKAMSNELIEIAKAENIPYDLEVMSGRTSTTADQIMLTKCGIPTALVSIPERYAHTPIEMADLNDVEQTARLICSFVSQKGGSK